MTLQRYFVILLTVTGLVGTLLFSLVTHFIYRQTDETIKATQLRTIVNLLEAHITSEKADMLNVTNFIRNDELFKGQFLLAKETKDKRLVQDYIMRLQDTYNLGRITLFEISQGDVEEKLFLHQDSGSMNLVSEFPLEIFSAPVAHVRIERTIQDKTFEKIKALSGAEITLGARVPKAFKIKVDGLSMFVDVGFSQSALVRKNQKFWHQLWVGGALALVALIISLFFILRCALVKPMEDLAKTILDNAKALQDGRVVRYQSPKKFRLKEFSRISLSYAELTNNLKIFQKVIEEKERNLVYQDVTRQVAHDIRSPLTAINIALSSLKEGVATAQVIKLLATSAQKINAIANEVLDLTRSQKHPGLCESRPDESLHLALLVDRVVREKQLEYIDSAGVQFQWTIDPSSYGLFVRGDSCNLERALSNLIDNAIESYECGGRVEISIEQEDDRAKVVVKDYGCGIAELYRGQIFSKGFSSKGASGNGLGLTYVQNVVSSMNGRVDFSTSLGHGSEFVLDLPLTEQPQWFIGRIQIEPEILVVDDDIGVHTQWLDHLKQLVSSNVKILCFSSVEALEAYLKENIEGEKTILLDYYFGKNNRDGLDFISQHPQANTILVTNSFDDPEVLKVAQQDNVRILPKPLIHVVPAS
jgi:signal transduction histidine kinase